MYNYRPIGIYASKSMADEEREGKTKKDFFEKSMDVEPQQKKKTVNLIITLESDGKAQFDDTNNTLWTVRHIPSFANYESIVDLVKRFNFKNVALVHHGNVFSDHTYSGDKKVVLNGTLFSTLTKCYLQMPKKDLMSLDDKYFEDLRKETEKYFKEGLLLKEVKSYISLRLLLSNMQDNSNFFSIACNEADDKEFLPALGNMTDKTIKIFANSNRSEIALQVYEEITSTKKKYYFGSLLNTYLTPNQKFYTSDGWYIYNTQDKTQIATKKDLWLLGTGQEVYLLMDRDFKFSNLQEERLFAAQKYYSKKYKIFYTKTLFGTEDGYNKKMSDFKRKFPDVIK